MVNIEDIIAEARAEEEIAREKKVEKPPVNISISLDRYEELILKAADFDRIIGAIVSGFKASTYTAGKVVFNGDNTEEAFKALYPDIYKQISEEALANQTLKSDEVISVLNAIDDEDE